MTVEHGRSGQGSEPSSARAAALVRDAQLALAEAEQLLAEVQRATTTLTAADLAARQAAIVDAAHEEAAVILAKAHADAARLLERAVGGARSDTSDTSDTPDTPPAVEPAGEVVDLRGDDVRPPGASDSSMTTTAQSPPAHIPSPPSPSPPSPQAQNAPGSTPGERDSVAPDVRASIAAAADMARRVSGRIERLSQDLHQAPTP